ncbi:MAG: hypothetical protein ABI868_03655 [Acidobacteriota bacterium]
MISCFRGQCWGPALAFVVAAATLVHAHSGPPFPILTNRVAGPYEISIWADPDATDDGSAAGQFWVMLGPAAGGGPLPGDTHADLSIQALDRAAPRLTGRAQPVNHEIARQFAAIALDHEGRFAVSVSVDGALGPAAVDATVDATYDLRPAPILMAVYLMPFVLIGFLWVKLLVRRRRIRG